VDLFRPYLDKPDAHEKAARNGGEGNKKSGEYIVMDASDVTPNGDPSP
jgi:hypothetical protein